MWVGSWNKASVSFGSVDRNLDWPGCINARDLGGLRISDARLTKRRAVVRSDNPAYLTPEGWSAMSAYGVHTIVALRTRGTADEEPVEGLVPPGIVIERVAIEDASD